MKTKNKRQKQVFQNADLVAEVFAKQSQDHARCKNAFFDGARLFSYGHHYLLAQILENKIAIVNFQSYSRTTSSQSWSAYNELIKGGLYSS